MSRFKSFEIRAVAKLIVSFATALIFTSKLKYYENYINNFMFYDKYASYFITFPIFCS